MFQQFAMANTSRGARGCRKSVIGASLDFESALETRGGLWGDESGMIALDHRVFPFHSAVFQPPVRDDSVDHSPDDTVNRAFCLHYVDARGEGVLLAMDRHGSVALKRAMRPSVRPSARAI